MGKNAPMPASFDYAAKKAGLSTSAGVLLGTILLCAVLPTYSFIRYQSDIDHRGGSGTYDEQMVKLRLILGRINADCYKLLTIRLFRDLRSCIASFQNTCRLSNY